MVANQIEREIVIDAPVERVWTTLTSAEHLGKWFADNGAEIDLRPGGSIVLRWKDFGTTLGRVEKVESPHTFAYRWVPAEVGQGLEISDTNSTLVEFSLTSEGSGTRLRVVESGFSRLNVSDAQHIYEEHNGGWDHELNELRDYAQALVSA